MRTAGLTVTVTRDQGHPVVSVAGELDMDTSAEVSEALTDATPEVAGPGVTVLDLRGVTFIDSTGLALLVRARRRIMMDESELVLVTQSSGAVPTMLRVTGLLNAFRVFGSVDEALAS